MRTPRTESSARFLLLAALLSVGARPAHTQVPLDGVPPAPTDERSTAPKPSPTEDGKTALYRDFAMTHPGNPEAGRHLFDNHEQLLCKACHRVTGMEKSGPNLDGIGDKFTRRQLIDEILRPSASIKPGYEQAIVLTADGKLLQGRLERSTKLSIRLIDTQGKQINLDRDAIDELRFSDKSLMPDGVVETISKQQFANLIRYLETLKFGVKTGLAAADRRIEIPRLKRPVRFQPIHSAEDSFANPVWCGAIPGLSGQIAVVEHQQGKIWRYLRDHDGAGGVQLPRKVLFADLGDELHISGNQGLMCIAFHPDYERNRRYFLEYEVREEGKVKTTIAERRATDDGLTDSGAASIRLLEVEQPAFNHNGGCIAFGPDGMLYAAFGDGGPQKDPPGFSQNPRVLLGSMIRVNVDQATDDKPYTIPEDNPFLAARDADPEIRPETWAIGFREPWRFSFDSLTGELFVGDVGQNKFEEVCIVKSGENHGWNVMEGFAPFSDEYRRRGERYADPLFVYEHGLGFSVTGGHVYRADDQSSFYGVYIFGDYNTRRVWGLRQRQGELMDVRELGTAPGGIASFGVDERGELILVTYGGQLFHVDLTESEYQ